MSKDQENNSGKLAFIITEDDQKNHIEWTAYKSKLIAAARAKKINRALLFNKQQDKDDAAEVEALAKAWAMLITPIQSAELVATLAGRFADEGKELYEAAKHSKSASAPGADGWMPPPLLCSPFPDPRSPPF